jgi:hypothetical protein
MDSATYSLEQTLELGERIEDGCKLLRGGKFVERRFAEGERDCACVRRFVQRGEMRI